MATTLDIWVWTMYIIAEISIGQHYSRVNQGIQWNNGQENLMGKRLAKGNC